MVVTYGQSYPAPLGLTYTNRQGIHKNAISFPISEEKVALITAKLKKFDHFWLRIIFYTRGIGILTNYDQGSDTISQS